MGVGLHARRALYHVVVYQELRPSHTSDLHMDETPDEITTLVGREVYSNNGVFVGEVDDVQLNLDASAVTGLAIGGLNDELFESRVSPGHGVILPYRWVRAVGDVILVNDVVERMKDAEDGDDGVAV